MNKYLITLSIGPIQDFIAAARKSRDLWLGSYMLSEISKAAAKSFYQADKHCLIFPSPKTFDDLEPGSSFNVGNKILVLVHTDEPKTVLTDAKEAAKKYWENIADSAKKKAEKTGIQINDDLWKTQVNEVLEFYGAWIKYEDDGTKEYYKTQRERLDALLNARKNTREFKQNKITQMGIPKSSLDGLRENVIDSSMYNKSEVNKRAFRKANINENEYLDCPGIVKRLGAEPEQFTPLSRIAIDPWLRGMPDSIDYNEIESKMKGLRKLGLVSQVRGNKGHYATLPFDGQLLYPFRLEAEKNKIKSNTDEVLILLKELELAIKTAELKKHNGESSPYVAIIVADGDRMGELLDEMQTLQEHRDISKILAAFAIGVPDILRKYHGHCIYAGGDDVLALVPLDQAIECSRSLADTFKAIMKKIDNIPSGKVPTLSVGLGISHMMTPMTKQLGLARKAEGLAKGNKLSEEEKKNALAVIIQPRSGAEISFREKWDNKADQILKNWVTAHLDPDGIPRQAGYQLREEAIALDWCNDDLEKYKGLIEAETERIMKRKRIKNEQGDDVELNPDWINLVCKRASQKGLRAIADELIMTYRIAQTYQLADKTTSHIQEGANV